MLPVEPTVNLQERNPRLRVVKINSPEGVPEEECGDLVALVGPYTGGIFDGGPVIKTFWKPSDEELEVLKAGGVIELDFFSDSIYPTAMNVEYL